MFKAKAYNTQADFEITDSVLKAIIAADTQAGWLEFTLEFAADWDDYVFFPACCYDGNRFDVQKQTYPPLFNPASATVDMPITITDIPRLEKDGSGRIEITTGDLSTPCAGVFSHSKKQAWLLFTIQEVNCVNLGLSYETGKISVTYPHMRREKAYRWPFLVPSPDKGIILTKGQQIEIPYRLLEFPCGSIEEFFRIYFENRKCMKLNDSLPKALSWELQFDIQREKFNTMNWRPEGRFYGVGTENTPLQTWQPGWVGGGISSYALMKLGGSLEEERALNTLRHLISTQSPSGFLHESSDEKGNVVKGIFGVAGAEDWHLVRKSADSLYFILKHFFLMRERGIIIPKTLENGARRLADAFVRLWERYNQFGQFVNLESGELVVGGSTSAAIAGAGLVLAYRFWGEEIYLQVAEESAEMYYKRDALRGYTTGGPEEILQCPDSESAFGLLESLVLLHECTGIQKWLLFAMHTAHLCSSWVLSYNYRFPESSEFARLDMRTTGCVFANTQNKHAAPGICTLSGDSLYKLYKWTGNTRYLELFNDIAVTIGQYISTQERPIYSWDKPKGIPLPQGFICERVNMSDWEGTECIGGVFCGSCWCETSNLLTLAEVTTLNLDLGGNG